MKELTIKEKAEAYDKVLEVVKNLREANPSDEGIQNWVKENFPELKESEDERIKKALLKMVNDTPRDIIWNNYGVHKEDAIDWFEKQGNVDNASYEIAEKEKHDFVNGQFIDCRKSFDEFKEDNSYWLEYVGNDIYIGRSDNILGKEFHITPRQLYCLFAQQHCSKESNVNEETNAPIEYECALKSFKDEDVRKFMQYIEKEAKAYEFNLPNRSYDIYAFAKDILYWLEKQGEQKPVDSRQEIKLNGGIVYEDFNEGDGYYKVNLGYLSKQQVEIIENLVASWQNPVDKAIIEPNTQTDFPEFVDLGLPSGTLWADRNLGANTPEESGDYYRFGETVPFTENSSVYVCDEIEERCIAGTEKDAATVLLGEEYSTPTIEHIRELLVNCKWEVYIINNTKGMKVTGLNGNSIFLPACGYRCSYCGKIYTDDLRGFYWSASASNSSSGHYLYFNSYSGCCGNFNRAYGYSIRAIKEIQQ